MTEQAYRSFTYRAQTADGQTITGTIDAPDLGQAQTRLQSLQLKLLQVQPAPPPPRPRSLGGEDFLAFNQQLAQLTGAGLPVEQGLRLIGLEMRRGGVRRTIDQVASDLESGKTLAQAIDARRGQFPPLYSRLIDAGIRAGNLPAILLNLGRHITLVRRLQAMLWRTFSYPILVLAVFLGILCFVLVGVVPQFVPIFRDMRIELPPITELILWISVWLVGAVWYVVATVVLLIVVVVSLLRMIGRDRVMAEALVLPLPLIGPVLRRNLVARWCDAVGLGIEAGMDLPAAIALADHAIGSPKLRADGEAIVTAISAGQPIAEARAGKILPPTVIAAIDLASGQNNLPEGLRALSLLNQQQAELRLAGVEGTLAPLVILLMGLALGFIIVGLFMPMISLIQGLSGPSFMRHH